MKVESYKVEGLVDQALVKKAGSKEYSEGQLEPLVLLTNDRLDIAFKLFFLTSNRYKALIGEHIYKEHIRAFTQGSFSEPGNSEKNTIESYLETFLFLSSDIGKRGFDKSLSLIPVSPSKTILNGAHRVSAAIYSGCSVRVVTLPVEEPRYDAEYFLQRGVDPRAVELAVTEFIEWSDNSYIALIWPSATSMEKLESAENLFPNIIYKKNVSLNYEGGFNLLSQIYARFDWLGNHKDKFKGLRSKLDACFKSSSDVRVIAFQCESLDRVNKIKEEIRLHFGLGNHSIHITDTAAEAKEVARLLFNENSIHFLNNAKPYKFDSTNESLKVFKNILIENGLDETMIALDTGMVLSVYGLRETQDTDCLFLGESKKFEGKEIDSHDDQLKYHGIAKSDLLLNPKYFFYYAGVKFISLEQVYNMKALRGQRKDKEDLILIRSLFEMNRVKKTLHSFLGFFVRWKVLVRFAIKNVARKILVKAGLLEKIQSWRGRK